jgi:hypothetical protein
MGRQRVGEGHGGMLKGGSRVKYVGFWGDLFG